MLVGRPPALSSASTPTRKALIYETHAVPRAALRECICRLLGRYAPQAGGERRERGSPRAASAPRGRPVPDGQGGPAGRGALWLQDVRRAAGGPLREPRGRPVQR